MRRAFFNLVKSENNFKSEYLKEDDFRKNLVSNGIGALVIAPILAFVYYYYDFPSSSVLGVLCYTFLFPVYALISAFIPFFREKLLYLLMVHLFVWTFLCFLPIASYGFEMNRVLVAGTSYILSTIIIQRYFPAILFQVFIGIILVYLRVQLDEDDEEKLIVFWVLLIIGVSNILMMTARRIMVSSLEDYADYMKRILNSTENAYILFNFSNGWKIIDNNEEVSTFFSSSDFHQEFFEFFSPKELDKLNSLKTGVKFEKTVPIHSVEQKRFLHMEVSSINFRNNQSLLAILSDVSDQYFKQQELITRERKYRNLYDKNRAGVFTLDKRSVIIDANKSFFQMFEETIRKGDQIFDWENEKEWELILDVLDRNPNGQNYQTMYSLKNGAKKSFVFNWYFDKTSSTVEGSVIDLTATQQAALALKQSEEKYRSIFEESNDAILLLEGDYIVDFNRTAQSLFGLSKEKTGNLFDLSLDQTLESERIYAFNRSKLAQKKNLKFNWEFIGKTEPMEAQVSLIEITLNGKLYYQCVIHDETEQNKLAAEKARAQYAEDVNERLESEIKERIIAEKKLNSEYLRTKAILDSSTNTFLLTIGHDQRISGFNSHCKTYFCALFNVELELGMEIKSLFARILSKKRQRLLSFYLFRVLRGASHQLEVKLITDKRNEYWMEIFMNPIFNDKGAVSEISLVAHDISEKKKASTEIVESLKEKEVLLKEIHHRVKNNLQIISSILNLQSSFVTDENTLGILLESRNRIRSMAIIHENLYKTEDFSSVDFGMYIENLCANLIASYQIGSNIRHHTKIESVNLVLDQAIPCGLLLNEVITNSLKYAFEPNTQGLILVELFEREGKVHLIMSDNGKGLPKPYEEMSTETLGLQLISTLVEQLDGELVVDISNGTKYLLKFDNINNH